MGGVGVILARWCLRCEIEGLRYCGKLAFRADALLVVLVNYDSQYPCACRCPPVSLVALLLLCTFGRSPVWLFLERGRVLSCV